MNDDPHEEDGEGDPQAEAFYKLVLESMSKYGAISEDILAHLASEKKLHRIRSRQLGCRAFEAGGELHRSCSLRTRKRTAPCFQTARRGEVTVLNLSRGRRVHHRRNRASLIHDHFVCLHLRPDP